MINPGGTQRPLLTDEEKRLLRQHGSSIIGKAILKSLGELDVPQPPASIQKNSPHNSSLVLPQESHSECGVKDPPVLSDHSSEAAPSETVQPSETVENTESQTVGLSSQDVEQELIPVSSETSGKDKMVLRPESQDSIERDAHEERSEIYREVSEAKVYRNKPRKMALALVAFGVGFLVAAILVFFSMRNIIEVETNARLDGRLKERFIARLLSQDILRQVAESVTKLDEANSSKQEFYTAFLGSSQPVLTAKDSFRGRKFYLSVQYPDAALVPAITDGFYQAFLINFVAEHRQQYWEKELRTIEDDLHDKERYALELEYRHDIAQRLGRWQQIPEQLQRQIRPMVPLVYRTIQVKAAEAGRQLVGMKRRLESEEGKEFLEFITGHQFTGQPTVQEYQGMLIDVVIEQELLSFCNIEGRDYLKRSLERQKSLEREAPEVVLKAYQGRFLLADRSQLANAVQLIIQDARYEALKTLERVLKSKQLLDYDPVSMQTLLRGLRSEIEMLRVRRNAIVAILSQPLSDSANLIVGIRHPPVRSVVFVITLTALSFVCFGAAALSLRRCYVG